MEMINLLDRAKQIKHETEDGANTSERVGGLLVDMIDSFRSLSMKVLGHYDSLDDLRNAFPSGSSDIGMYAVGLLPPYDYYMWYNGNWENQGKLVDYLSVYVTSLNFFEIQDGQFTDYRYPDYLEALNIIEQFKAGKLVVVRNVKKIGDYEERYIFGALNVYHKNSYSEDGSTFVFTLVDDRMRLMQYTLMEAWMTWRVEEVRTVGEPDRLINISSPVYDIPNSKVTFQINEITQGVHFFEGFINIGGTVCRVSETINLESMEKRKSITVLNDEGNTSLSLFLDYSSSRISLTNVFGTVPSITATDFKLIKL